MTLPVNGGVPEQGLRDAAQRVLKEFEVPSIDGKDRRFDYAACDWCDGEGEETHPETIAHEPSCVIGQLRAALERPRPALPKPTAFCVQCGFAQMDTTRVLDGQTIPAPWQVDQCGAAWSDVYNAANSVCANWLTEGHATPQLSRHLQTLSTALMILDQKRVTGPVPMDGDTFTWKERADKAEAELARLRGAALPPQTGNPPLEPSETAIEAAREASAHTGELGMADHLLSRRTTIGMLRAAYAIDFGGVSSLRAPQSGPWIAKQSGRDWIVVAPSLQDTPGTSCWQADDFAPREQAEAVRDALNRVAGSGAETPEGTKP